MLLVHRSKSIAMVDSGYGNRAVNGVLQYSHGNTNRVHRMVFKGPKRSMTLGTTNIWERIATTACVSRTLAILGGPMPNPTLNLKR